MDEHELIKRLGLPDEIVGPEDRLSGTAWICFTCGETTTSHKPIPCPAPCSRCRGIMFQTWSLDGPGIRRCSQAHPYEADTGAPAPHVSSRAMGWLWPASRRRR
jgi:hypothetical protein